MPIVFFKCLLICVCLAVSCKETKSTVKKQQEPNLPKQDTPAPKSAQAPKKATTPDAPFWRLDPTPKKYKLQIQQDGIWLGTFEQQAYLNFLPKIILLARTNVHKTWQEKQTRAKQTPFTYTQPHLVKNPDGSWHITTKATHPLANIIWTIRATANAPVVEASLQIQYKKNVLVQEESLQFDYTGPTPKTLKTDYRWHTPKTHHHTGQQTPRRIQWPGMALNAPTAQGIKLDPFAKKITLQIDHRQLHPFKIYDDCPTSAAFPKRWLDETPRYKNQTKTYTFSMLLGAHPIPLPRRFSSGYLSAISLTDHADQNQTSRTEAFAFGQTNAIHNKHTTRGFVGHGLNYSKTIFLEKKGSYAKQYSDPKFLKILNALKANHVELGLHSVSGLSDTPSRSKTLIKQASKDYTFKTWIDHGPGTNCEAISNRGWNPNSDHYMLDILADANINTFWAVKDLPVPGGRLNQLASTQKPKAILYRHERLKSAKNARTPTLFASAWFFGSRSSWIRRFSNANLERMSNEHGLLLAHTYLDTWRRTGKFADRSLLKKSGDGHTIDPKIDTIFERISKRQARKKTLTSGVDHLANHLLDSLAVHITPDPSGGFRIENKGHTNLQGLTLRLPPQTKNALLDGQPLLNTQRHKNGLDVWFDLKKNQTKILRLRTQNNTTLNTFNAIKLHIIIQPSP